jgi:hypothetical protein
MSICRSMCNRYVKAWKTIHFVIVQLMAALACWRVFNHVTELYDNFILLWKNQASWERLWPNWALGFPVRFKKATFRKLIIQPSPFLRQSSNQLRTYSTKRISLLSVDQILWSLFTFTIAGSSKELISVTKVSVKRFLVGDKWRGKQAMFEHPLGSPDLVNRRGLILNNTNAFRSGLHQYF